MSNILPQELITTRNRQALVRALLVASIAAVFISCVVVLAVLPAYIDARVERIAREEGLQALGGNPSGAAAKGRTERETLDVARRRAESLEHIGKKQRVADAIALAVESRQSGVTVKSFNYVRKMNEGTLEIAGTVSDRLILKEYTDRLKGKDPFSKVAVPIGSLAKVEGGLFSLTATGVF